MKLEDLDWWKNVRKKERFCVVDNKVHKKCTRCGMFKSLDLFVTEKHTVDKKTPDCGYCRGLRQDRAAAKERYHKNGYSKKKAEYFQKNKERICNQRKESLEKDITKQLVKKYRSSIRKQRLRSKTRKDNKSIDLIGCTKEQLYEHLKSTFEINYNIAYKEEYFNDLHIDHIIPKCLSMDEEDLKILNHYTNLQFLHKSHNMEKKNKLDYQIPQYPLEENS
jgi:hypothetical protein